MLIHYCFYAGILANNPTLDLLTEISEYNLAQKSVDRAEEAVQPEILLSLGTGIPPIKNNSDFEISTILEMMLVSTVYTNIPS